MFKKTCRYSNLQFRVCYLKNYLVTTDFFPLAQSCRFTLLSFYRSIRSFGVSFVLRCMFCVAFIYRFRRNMQTFVEAFPKRSRISPAAERSRIHLMRMLILHSLLHQRQPNGKQRTRCRGTLYIIIGGRMAFSSRRRFNGRTSALVSGVCQLLALWTIDDVTPLSREHKGEYRRTEHTCWRSHKGTRHQ